MRAILTGKVVHRADSLHIQTELVDVSEVSQLWGQQYDRKFTEILAVQEEIARQVSEKLRLRPTGEEQKRMGKRSTENTEAYQLYLKGRYYLESPDRGAAEEGERVLPAGHRQGSGLRPGLRRTGRKLCPVQCLRSALTGRIVS